MLLKIVCLLMRWLFSLAVLMSSGDREKDAELLVLLHENAVLRRNAGRVRINEDIDGWVVIGSQPASASWLSSGSPNGFRRQSTD